MGDFNRKRYYGLSLCNDPSLCTTVRNFEFRYARPEHLEKAIQKVQLTDNAALKQKKSNLLNSHCKLHKLSKDIKAPYRPDSDVETQISFSERIKTRPLSDNEIDQLVYKATSTMILMENQESAIPKTTILPKCQQDDDYGHNENHAENCFDDLNIEMEGSSNSTLQYDERTLTYESDEETKKGEEENLKAVDLAQLPDLFDNQEFNKMDGNVPRRYEKVIIEEYNKPIPQWVEVVEPPVQNVMIVRDVDSCSNMKSAMSTTESNRLFSCPKQYKKVQKSMHNYEEKSPSLNIEMPKSYDMEKEFFVEDSDLEYEVLNHRNYTKYCSPCQNEQEMTCISNHDGGVPNFVEIEPNPPKMKLSLLKNTKPMQYTELTDDIPDTYSVKHTKTPTPKPLNIKKMKKEESKPRTITGGAKKKSQLKTPHQNINSSAGNTPKTSPRTKYLKSTEQQPQSPGRNYNFRQTKLNSPRTGASIRDSPNSNNGRSYLLRNRKAGKTLDELKIEKMHIFNRMKSSQERIIEILDKLKLTLLEANIPENIFEKSRRQRNAFEFSVRFSRNFLYPLKGMIEDLKITTVEQFNSASSNEATNRLGSTFSLLHQALEKYQKQLRYFLLDQVPQKLNVLIEMIYTVTTLSLEKGLLDQNDPITDCLQLRCSKFLEFLEESYTMARDNHRKSQYQRHVHSSYDLKMFLNDLNMYEPKLVPKENIRAKRSRRKLVAKKIPTGTPENSSKMVVNKNEDVATRLQNENKPSVPTLIVSSADQSSEKNRALNKAIFDALQTVTQDQVRLLLKPLLESLGNSLDKTRNTELIESLLNMITTIASAENKRQRDQKTVKGRRTQLHGGRQDKRENYTKTLAQQSPVNPTKKTKLTSTVEHKANESETKLSTTEEGGKATTAAITTAAPHAHHAGKSQRKRSLNTTAGNLVLEKKKNFTQLTSGDYAIKGLTADRQPDNLQRHVESNYEQYKGQKGASGTVNAPVLNSESELSESSSPPDTDLEEVNKMHTAWNRRQDNVETTNAPRLQRIQKGNSKQNPHPMASNIQMSKLKGDRKNYPNKDQQIHKIGHLKKKRNCLLPPPPAPAVTPNSSARSCHGIKMQSEINENFPKYVNSRSSCTDDYDEIAITMGKQRQDDCVKTQVQLDGENEIPFVKSFEFDEHNVCHRNPNQNFNELYKKVQEMDLPIENLVTINMANNLLYTSKSPYEDRVKVDARNKSHREDQQHRQHHHKREGQRPKGDPPRQGRKENRMDNIPGLEQQANYSDLPAFDHKEFAECIGDNADAKLNLNVKSLLRERDHFLSLTKRNRFYDNPNFKEPWKTFSHIAMKIVNDVVNMVENDFSMGVSKFIEDFIQAESQT